jgi:hypothetical protein
VRTTLRCVGALAAALLCVVTACCGRIRLWLDTFSSPLFTFRCYSEGAGLTTHAGAAISRNTAQRVAVTSEVISRAGVDALHLLRSAATAGAPLPDDHAAPCCGLRISRHPL